LLNLTVAKVLPNSYLYHYGQQYSYTTDYTEISLILVRFTGDTLSKLYSLDLPGDCAPRSARLYILSYMKP